MPSASDGSPAFISAVAAEPNAYTYQHAMKCSGGEAGADAGGRIPVGGGNKVIAPDLLVLAFGADDSRMCPLQRDRTPDPIFAFTLIRF